MPALLLLFALAAAPKPSASGPRFIEDDYAKALKTAKAGKKLLFVDAWAPWCHSCVAMKEQVFSRDGFKAFEKDVVFASIDTEKAKSARFLEQYPVNVWPTLLFIDPTNEKVVLRWLGSADEAQMQALLTAARAGGDADRAFGAGDDSAVEKYQAALAAGSADSRLLLSALAAMSMAKKNDACARTVLEQLPAFSTPQDRAVALSYGLWCALELPEGKERTQALDQLVPAAQKALSSGVLADDVSGLYEALVEERSQAKDTDGAKTLGAQWLAYLDGEAAKAKTPAERAVFDAHRTSAALQSGQAQKMEAPLQQSETDFPKDYNPPARLALVYRELGRLDDASAAIERALKKCKEGPRKLRLFETKVSIQKKQGDEAAATKTLQEALTYAKKLPKSQLSEKRLAALQAQVPTEAPKAKPAKKPKH